MKKILQFISFILILFVSNNAFTQELPANIHNVVPEFAVKEKTFKQYTVKEDTFRGMFLPGNAALGSYAIGIALGLIEKKDYKFFIGTSSGAIGTIFLYANDKKEVAKFTRGLDSDKILSNNIKFLSLLFGKSFAENKPLKDYIYKHITNKIIDKMAKRYKQGYRGFVASTDINTGKNVIWDLGALAFSKKYDYDYKRDMLAKIIVASAALPGIFPPSTFNVTYKNKQYTQTHVDGGLGFTVVLKKWLLPSNLDSISKKSFYIVQTDEYVSKNPS